MHLHRRQVLSRMLSCLSSFHFSTLDLKLKHPALSLLLRYPSSTVLLVLITYLAIIILTLPLYLMSFLITGYITACLFIVLCIATIQSIGRYMTYPGSSLSIQREISVDYLKRLSAQLLQICKQVSSLMNHIEVLYNQSSHHSNEHSLISKISEIQSIPIYLFQLSRMVGQAVQVMKDNGVVGQYTSFETFQLSIYQVAHHIQALQCILQKHRIELGHREVTTACLKSVEELHDFIVQTLPPKLEPDHYHAHLMYHISSFIYGPQKFEKLMFPLMQQQFIHSYQAEMFTLRGNAKNIISGAWISSHKHQPVGTLLFCCPNLGIVECIGLSNQETSWIGFYVSLGFHICVFNYRGYYTSTGSYYTTWIY